MKTMLRKTLITLAFALGLTTFAFGEAVETVAYWHKDFANGSVKNGFTMSLGAGTTVNADGTVTLKQTTSGTATKGVEINFYDASGATALSGSDMTVFVRYSGLTYSSSRNAFFSTIWGDSKTAKELTVSRKGDGKFYYEANVTSSANPTDSTLGSVTAAPPTAGLMIITMAGGGKANGTRIGFAPLNEDGSYGDVVDYGYASGATYSGKKFYGIKVGGTIGAINHFHRPGMKVEGVAIVKGFTTTMRTFRYLFPDECYRFDYSGTNPTSEKKYLEGLTVKNIKDAVFSAKVATGSSTTWAYGMVSACQKAFTPSATEPTKVALQYQFRESDYDKSADIYFTDKTDGIYFMKTGGHYNGISGDKLGTDDAKWSNSSTAYSFNNFSVYVPYTKTAAATTGNWSALGWTADDIARLDVKADATMTVDAASAVALLKAKGAGKLTLKYTDKAKLVTSKIWDFTETTVALDCADVAFEGEVVLMSGTIKGYENIDIAGSALPANSVLLVSGTAVTLKGAYTAVPEGSVNFSDLTWSPGKPEGGFTSDSILIFKNTKDATVTFNENLTVSRLVTENTAALTLQNNNATVAISTYDCSLATGTTTIEYDFGASVVKPGVDTVVKAVGTSAITVDEGMKLTVKSGEVKESKITNNGTLGFDGGSAESPIVYDTTTSATDLGKMTLAAGAYVKVKTYNAKKVFNVTGAGAESSTIELYDTNGKGQGMPSNAKFRKVTLVVKFMTSGKHLWLENSPDLFDATVDIVADGNTMFNSYDYTIGSLSGAGAVGMSGSRKLTITPSEDVTYSGTSAVPFTIAAGAGTQTLTGNYTGALTVNAGGKAKVSGSANPSSIVNNGTLDMDLAATYKLPQGNGGTINLYNNDLVIMVTDPQGTVNTLGTGKIIYGYTVTINDCGKFKIPEGKTVDVIKLYNVGGEEVTYQVEGDTLTFDWEITDKNCWWDYEFNGNVTSTGADTTTMTAEGTKPYYDEATTNYLWVGHARHYRSVSAYPQEFTAILYGKVVDQEKQFEVGFGSSTDGSKINVSIACGDPTAEEVQLLIAKEKTVQKTVSMSVPNAYKADHLYAFVCKTIADGDKEKTKVIVYLDGVEWDSYTFDEKITLGTGFQIGSIHGGIPTSPSGYAKATVDNANAFLDFLRTYNVALNAEAMSRYANLYPYTSENGKAMRTFTGETTWVTENGTWTQKIGEESYTTNCPLPGTMIDVTATAAATVTVNLDEQANYESFTTKGEGSFTFKAGGTVEPTVSGLATIGTPVTVDYNAIKFGKTMVLAGKTLTFDFTGFPLGEVWADGSYEVTGAVTLNEGAKILATGIPTAAGRTATFGLNEFGHYALNIKIAREADIVMTVDAQGATTWTCDGQPIPEPQWNWSTLTNVTFTKKGEGTGSFIGRNGYTYTVDKGVLKFTNNVEWVASTITVNKGGAFDLDGNETGSHYDVILNGGTLANYGEAIAFNKRALKSITLKDDSFVTTSNNICFVSDGYKANVLDLGGHTLTKNGSKIFILMNTTVTNGAVVVEKGEIRVNAPSGIENHTVFADDATLELKTGTGLYVNLSSLVLPEITGEGKVKVDTTLTVRNKLEGSLAVSGSGTLTLAKGAVLDLAMLEDAYAWPTQIACAETQTINLNGRTLKLEDKIIAWDAIPEGIKFQWDSETAKAGVEPKYEADGLLYGYDPESKVVDKGYWTGAVDGDGKNPANWGCTNKAGYVVADAIPTNAEATVILNGPLAGDCDWTGLGAFVLAQDTLVDLNGHSLAIADFANRTTGIVVTNTVEATGDFVINVPAEKTAENTAVAIRGNVRLVKEGAGTYKAAFANQTYTGGSVVNGGIATMTPSEGVESDVNAESKKHFYGANGTSLTINAEGTFELGGNYDWHVHPMMLNGGTLQNTLVGMNKYNWGGVGDVTLAADSTVRFTKRTVFNHENTAVTLNGHTLTLDGTDDTKFYTHLPFANGKVDITGGVFVNLLENSASETADFTFTGNSDYEPGATITVRDFSFNGNTGWKWGDKLTTVVGTFTPGNNAFHNTMLADGSTLNLKEVEGTWSVDSVIAGKSYKVTFAENATNKVDVTGRTIAAGDKLVSWTTQPAETTAFVFKGYEGDLEPVAEADGLYARLALVQFTIADVENATKEVEGATLVSGNTYSAKPGADVTVTYTADPGYFFEGGSKTSVVTAKAAKDITITTETERVVAAAKIGETDYYTFEAAMAAATAGQTVTLLKSAELAGPISVAKQMTLDIGAFNVTPATGFAGGDGLFFVNYGGDFTVTGSTGTIDASSNPEDIYEAIKLTVTGETYAGARAKLTVNGGTIKGYYYGITGNGSRPGTDIVVNGGTITAVADKDNLAIFNPQTDSTVTITGGTLTGYLSAIEMRGGTLSVTGGQLTATATEYAVAASGSGTTTKGAAVAIAQHTTKGDIAVTISGGTISGEKCVSVANPQGNDTTNVAVELGAATYEGALAFSADGNAKVVNKGAEIAAPEGYKWDETGKLVKKTYVAQIGEKKYETLADAVAATKAGDTVTMLATVAENLTVKAPNADFTTDLASFGIGNVYVGFETATTASETLTVTGSACSMGNVYVGQADLDDAKGIEGWENRTYRLDIVGTGDTVVDAGSFYVRTTGTLNIKNATVTYTYVNQYGAINLTDATMKYASGVNFYITGRESKKAKDKAILTLDNSTLDHSVYELDIGCCGLDYNKGSGLVVLKNGSTLKAQSVLLQPNADGALGTIAIVSSNSTIEVKNGVTVGAGDFISMDATSTITCGSFTNNGTITVDITGATGESITLISCSGTADYGTVKTIGEGAYVVTTSGNNLVLQKAKAKIGDVYYISLKAANDAAKDGDTIELLADVAEGDGIFVTKNVTFDFGGFTYTITGNPVGSPGTENQGFHVEAANCTLKNGTIASVAGSGVKMLVQNYSDLSLVGMTLDGANISEAGKVRYVLSNNKGNTVIENTTITANEGDFAFDTCKYASYPIPTVEVKGTSVINGDVELSGGNLTLTAGTLSGKLKDGGIGEGVITKSPTFEAAAPEGYVWDSTGKLVKAVAKIGDVYYISLNAALEAAKDDDTVTLLADITTAEKAPFAINKNITLDFDTFTVTKTVANDYTFDIPNGATVTFKGTTGGAKQAASDKNPTSPASMIRNKGNLTIAGGVYTSDFCIVKNDEDPGAGTLTVNGGTFNVVTTEGGYTGFQTALMNWATATINGGTWNGAINTRSCDGNAVSKAGTTEIAAELEGSVKYVLSVGYEGDTTYENVPKIKGVALANVELRKVPTITDELKLIEKDGYVTVAAAYEAKIGTKYYITLDDATEEAVEGDTIELILSKSYLMPWFIPDGVTIAGAVENVTLDATQGCPNVIDCRVAFEDLAIVFGNQKYRGFIHATQVTMENCTLNGLFFSYGPMTFKDCTFVQETEEYCMWVYGGDPVTYDGCTFNVMGKCLNVYREYDFSVKLNVTNCTFNSTVKNKSALNFKETSGSTVLNTDAILADCKIGTPEFFPTDKVGGSQLYMIDDLVKGHTASGVKIVNDGEPVWPLVAEVNGEKYASLQKAADAATAGDTVKLLQPCTADGVTCNKAVTLDINGWDLTVEEGFTSVADLTLVNNDTTQGGFVVDGIVTVSGGTLDASGLSIGTGGVIPGKAGGIAVANGATFAMMNAWASYSPNWLAANRPGFLTAADGGMVKMGSTIYTAKDGLFGTENTVAKAVTTALGVTYTETFDTLTAAIAAANAGTTVTLLKDITTAEAKPFTIAKDITLDFGAYTITKTVANDYTFDIPNGATVIFKGTTGGAKQAASDKNPTGPASMIRNKGNLTIEGGVYTSDFCIVKNDEDPGAGTLTVNGGTFNVVTTEGGYTGFQTALMNWATATINGGTWNGAINTRSCDGNAVSKAGTTDVTATLEGSVKYVLSVGYEGDTTYENVPKIKGVALANVELRKVPTIKADLVLTEKDGYITVATAVAKIGNVYYISLKAANDAAKAGETIELLADVADGDGIFVTKDVTFDFGGFTYTVAKNPVGSPGTENQGFHLETANCVLTNGTISSTSDSNVKMLVQNYSNLTVAGMFLDGTNLLGTKRYVLSNNAGNTTVTGTTIIAKDGDFALDSCKYSIYDAPTVTLDETDIITGKVELSGGTLVPNGAEIDVSYAGKFAYINYVPYTTLKAAFDAVESSQTIEIAGDLSGDGIFVAANKITNVTVKFNGHTYTFTGNPVGSTGTENQGFHLEAGNTLTFLGGTITSTAGSGVKMLVQNYANLLLWGTVLDGTNLDGEGKVYTLSTNNGKTTLMGATVKARGEGDIAFDVCCFSPYTANKVLMQAGTTVSGDIEVSSYNDVAPELKLNGGTVNGKLVMGTGADKASITKAPGVELAAPEGYAWDKDGKLVKMAFTDGTKYYITLTEAFEKAASGATITLLVDQTLTTDVAVYATVPAGKTFTLDLAGKTITATSTFAAAQNSSFIENYGTLTVKGGEGGIAYSAPTSTNGRALFTNCGTLTIEDGTYTQGAGSTAYVVDNLTNGTLWEPTLTVNGGSLVSAGNTAIRQFANSTTKTGTINVNGGYIEATYYALQIRNANASKNKASVTIEGGTFEATASSWNCSVCSWAQEGESNAEIAITITGGTFNDYVCIEKGGTNAIEGGLFAKKTYDAEGYKYDLDDYCEGGFAITASGVPEYPYTSQFFPVKVGPRGYETLVAAVAAAEADQTVNMYAGLAGDGIFVSKDLTFDFGGFTYEVTANPVGSKGTESQGFHIETANCVLTNGTITSTSGSGVKMLVQNYANLTVTDMTLDGTNLDVGFASGDYVLSNNSGDTTLDNVTIAAQADDYAFDCDKTAKVTLESGTINGKIAVTGAGPLTINGGTINGPANGAAYDGKAVITVDGGTLVFNAGTLTATGAGDSGMYGVYVKNGGEATFGTAQGGPTITAWFAAIGTNNTTPGLEGVTITINNGTYTQLADGKGQWWSYFCAAVYAPAAGTYTVNGGTLDGALYSIAMPYENVEQTITITGGTLDPLFVAEGEGAGFGTRTIEVAPAVQVAAPAGYAWEIDASSGYKTLKKAVVKVGTTYYLTLKEANDAAKDNDTIELLADASGDGIFVTKDNLTFDFGGYTYTITGNPVGSPGTENQGFHIEAAKCTITDGTITSVNGSGVKMLVQNYSGLTLTGVTLDGTRLPDGAKRYVLSNNNGATTLGAGTTIVAKKGDYAFDVCGYSIYAGTQVKVEGADIIGDIEFSSDTNKHDLALDLNSGTLDGYIRMGVGSTNNVTATKLLAFEAFAPAGFRWGTDALQGTLTQLPVRVDPLTVYASVDTNLPSNVTIDADWLNLVGADPIAATNAWENQNGLTVAESYVLGLNPKDETDILAASVILNDDGTVSVQTTDKGVKSPENPGGRPLEDQFTITYTLYGKNTLDAKWGDPIVTSSQQSKIKDEVEGQPSRFYKTTVKINNKVN